MDSKTYFLAFSRLAERTAVFWGHATTSGIHYLDGNSRSDSTGNMGGVDYFISSRILESNARFAQRKYSERLLFLRGMTTAFPLPKKPLTMNEILGHGTAHLPDKREFLL